jgi:hypothetical protein
MLASSNLAFLLKSQNYSPEDLESMRQVFIRACGENPQMAETELQQSTLAKAVVNTYQRYLTQSELVAAALSKAK